MTVCFIFETPRYYENFKIDRKTGESNYTRLLTDEAVSFLESQANQTAPFFLLWTPDATHAPHYASKDFLGKSRRGQFSMLCWWLWQVVTISCNWICNDVYFGPTSKCRSVKCSAAIQRKGTEYVICWKKLGWSWEWSKFATGALRGWFILNLILRSNRINLNKGWNICKERMEIYVWWHI